jgi:hypothetical protein
LRASSLKERILKLTILRGKVNHGQEALSHHRLVRREEFKHLTEQSHELLTKSLTLIRSSGYFSLSVHTDERLLLHLLFRDACVLAQDTVAE